jgi:hypothetical protein
VVKRYEVVKIGLVCFICVDCRRLATWPLRGRARCKSLKAHSQSEGGVKRAEVYVYSLDHGTGMMWARWGG